MARLVASLFLTVMLLGAAAPFVLTSDDFAEQARLDDVFTYDQNGCTGANKVPRLSWSGAPAKARSFAVVVSDIDAYPSTFYHWIRIDIPAGVTQLPPADPNAPAPGLDTRNSFGNLGYAGPCPPKREAPHEYVFTVYALDVARLAKIGPNSKPSAVLSAMQGHIVGQAQLTGRYGRG